MGEVHGGPAVDILKAIRVDLMAVGRCPMMINQFYFLRFLLISFAFPIAFIASSCWFKM